MTQAAHPVSAEALGLEPTTRRVLLVGEPPSWQPAPAPPGRPDPVALELVAVGFADAGPQLASGAFEVAVANLTRDASARLAAVRRWRQAHPRTAWLAFVGPEPMLSEEVLLRAGVLEAIGTAEAGSGLGRAIRRALARRDALPAATLEPAAALELESPPLQTTRLASLGMMAAGMAHEINNPLAYVRSNLEYVLEEFGALEGGLERLVKRFPNVAGGATGFPDLEQRLAELRQAMDEANEGVTRVADVVAGLKQLSRRPRNDLQEVSLVEVARSSLRIASRTIRERARLETRLEPTPLVRGSHAHLGQVVLNLLVNAAHAVREAPSDGPRVVIATYRDASGSAVLEVSDTGPGMSAELAARIFEPFFTTKDPEGTGLGLPVSRQVVEAFGGRLSVETREGTGSTFRVTLPPA